MTKQQLRNELRSARDRLRPRQVENWSAEIAQRVLDLPEVVEAQIIHTYVNVRNEVQTRGLIETFWIQGKTVLVPVLTSSTTLESFHLTDWSQITVDEYGRCSPTGNGRYDGPIDVVIVPGLGYTLQGDRLGSGYGHYDRFLAVHLDVISIAPTYEFQIVQSIPQEPHDQRMDLVVTKEQVIRIQ